MDSYKTGNGPQQINLTVDINTIGIAASRANVGIPGPGSNPVAVAHSNDATGDIPLTPIGAASGLQGQSLVISTIISLGFIEDVKDRKKEFDRISASYILDNGIDGHKVFDKPDRKTAADDYSSVILYKQLSLTA